MLKYKSFQKLKIDVTNNAKDGFWIEQPKLRCEGEECPGNYIRTRKKLVDYLYKILNIQI